MPTQERIRLNKYEFAALMSEVDSLCPLCCEPLLSFDDNPQRALSQAAHIYPHSPTKEEELLLADVPRLSDSPESIHNLILLCPNCHYKFDHPRTKAGYNQLYSLKKQFITRGSARKYYHQHSIELDLLSVFQRLGDVDPTTDNRKLSYTAICIDQKMSNGASDIVKRMVRRDVHDYYLQIQDTLVQLEQDHSGKSDLIAKKINTFYTELQSQGLSQDDIYYAINEWLDVRTQYQYHLLTPLITAFYIQNCEVFSK